MSDLVERLRLHADATEGCGWLYEEAADEIEKLTRQRDQAREYASHLARTLIGCGDELP